ncbi:hypothetical protein PIB30_070790 [Stylosanthes scabra]|uniref:Secreted protein n=1 Tax=Stylosanthes scabra TaxID=79078 RepID=A0ABU6VPL9_9FABA|nr:hypothetical protein [Stylosanthes scabra]
MGTRQVDQASSSVVLFTTLATACGNEDDGCVHGGVRIRVITFQTKMTHTKHQELILAWSARWVNGSGDRGFATVAMGKGGKTETGHLVKPRDYRIQARLDHAKAWAKRDPRPKWCHDRVLTTPRRELSPLTTPRCGREAHKHSVTAPEASQGVDPA